MDLSFDEKAVIVQLGLEKSDAELQKRMIIRVRQLLAGRLQHRIQSEMTDQDYKKLATMSDGEAQEWLTQRFPNYPEWLREDLQTTVDFMTAHSATVETFKARRSR